MTTCSGGMQRALHAAAAAAEHGPSPDQDMARQMTPAMSVVHISDPNSMHAWNHMAWEAWNITCNVTLQSD